MKLIIKFFLFVIVAFAVSSCSLDGESNYTPEISLVSSPKTQNGDTLKLYYTTSSNEFLMDTVHVGDTVSFAVLVNAYTNNITAFYLTQTIDSVTRVKLADKQSLDSLFLASSDYNTGKFYPQSGVSAFVFPFKYIARAASSSAKFGLTVSSDAKFDAGFGGSNITSYIIKTPIKY